MYLRVSDLLSMILFYYCFTQPNIKKETDCFQFNWITPLLPLHLNICICTRRWEVAQTKIFIMKWCDHSHLLLYVILMLPKFSWKHLYLRSEYFIKSGIFHIPRTFQAYIFQWPRERISCISNIKKYLKLRNIQ